ncbi:MAG: WD40 repeat domain-containing protein, partial [Candidatus Omnitrophota bacterium]
MYKIERRTDPGYGIRVQAFSPDGSLFATGDLSGHVAVWNTSTGQKLFGSQGGHLEQVTQLAFSPDGATLVSAGYDGELIFWDVRTGLQKIQLRGYHSKSVTNLVYSPDGKTVASASYDKKVILWDAATGRWRRLLTSYCPEWANDLAFSPDSTGIVVGCADGTIMVWDAATGLLGQGFRGPANAVRRVAYSPDGKTLAAGYHDGLIIFFDALTGQKRSEAELIGHGGLAALVYSPGGDSVAMGYHDGSIGIWDVRNERLGSSGLFHHKDTIHKLAFSSDGKTLISSAESGEVVLWDILMGSAIAEPFTHNSFGRVDFVHTPDLERLHTASRNGDLIAWTRLSAIAPIEWKAVAQGSAASAARLSKMVTPINRLGAALPGGSQESRALTAGVPTTGVPNTGLSAGARPEKGARLSDLPQVAAEQALDVNSVIRQRLAGMPDKNYSMRFELRGSDGRVYPLLVSYSKYPRLEPADSISILIAGTDEAVVEAKFNYRLNDKHLIVGSVDMTDAADNGIYTQLMDFVLRGVNAIENTGISENSTAAVVRNYRNGGLPEPHSALAGVTRLGAVRKGFIHYVKDYKRDFVLHSLRLGGLGADKVFEELNALLNEATALEAKGRTNDGVWTASDAAEAGRLADRLTQLIADYQDLDSRYLIAYPELTNLRREYQGWNLSLTELVKIQIDHLNRSFGRRSPRADKLAGPMMPARL